ncbi:TAXI family TRAP transporter solute-binding subunit [Bacillus aquiflavi]|uniref:TAXI family TRAP transporter solute-binding subunit n=1 Tax=Bacillus aquiflavi TaxID=2672567 RepID=A0A6B3VR48_9BACI|nr:TAXI family TRAP transporter solute-binding subunit [Bacillus aquiflavi]MBA4536402.1 TAXI family TRAP transporter solute-binding subunit [Bacillus aquiflavi]NEY80770.1 TAXI family TRAP transporter solute-binding subunit [Bacillus aquiflavi]
MKRKKFLFAMILLLTFSMVLSACGGNKEDKAKDKDKGASDDLDFMSIVTGGTGGTYYPLGGAFAKLISDEVGVQTNSEVSGASAENMNTLKDGDAEIGFTQTDIASYAKDGKLMFEDDKVDNVVAIGALYPETIQIVTTEKSGIKTVEDLKGKKVSVGAPGSGTYANAEQILEIHGITMKDFKPQNLSFDESVNGIQDGAIDAAFVTAGTPTGAVEGLAATEKVVIVPIAEDKIKELIEKYPYYSEEEVPSGTYGLKETVNTVAVQAMLVVRDDLSEDLVYKVTKAIFENTDEISHDKGKLIKAENALTGLGIDVHPGAQKYFDEKGVK